MRQGFLGLVFSFLCVSLPGFATADVGPRSLDLTDATCCEELSLADSYGVRRQLSDFAGKVVIVTFGFARCPDICPTTLIELAQSMKSLQDKSKNVQVLFVTLDPDRDTGEMLSQYAPAFHPSFIALRGTEEETVKVARDFRVLYRKVPGQNPENYTLDHTVGVYIFDRSGKARVYSQSVKSQDILPEVERLLAMEGSQ